MTYGGMSDVVARGLGLYLESVSNAQAGYGFRTHAQVSRMFEVEFSIYYGYRGDGSLWTSFHIFVDVGSGLSAFARSVLRETQRRTAPMAQVSEGFMSGVTDGISDLLDQRDSRANRNTAAFAIGAGIGAVAAALLPGPGKFSIFSSISGKIARQLGGRGWTTQLVHRTVNKTFTTRSATNRANGNAATAYFNKNGSHVVRDNVTGQVIQISNRNDPNWIPDSTIINPYIP
jgi:hypothetical protein